MSFHFNSSIFFSLFLASLVAAFSGFVGAAEGDVARRTLLQEALAKQLTYGFQADDALWPQRMNFMTRMSEHNADAKPLLDAAAKEWRGMIGSPRYDVQHGGFFSAEKSSPTAKRLCEQALMTDVLLDAVQISNDDACREAAKKTLDFVLRDLRLATGGFAASNVLATVGSPPAQSDETIIPTWNGLMVGAFARGAVVLGNQEYYAAAEQIEAFILTRCVTASDGIAAIHGALALYQVAGSVRWLAAAIELQDRIDREFWDEETVSYRMKERNQLPDALEIMNLLRLAAITYDDPFRDRAAALLSAAITRAGSDTVENPSVLCAVDQHLGPHPHLMIVGEPLASDTPALFAVAHRTYQPRLVIVTHAGDPVQAELRKRFPGMVPSPKEKGKATAYLCVGDMCNRPTTDPAGLEKQLKAISYRWK
jgi:uncharacterized protein YyaL (SSP411 family)